MSEIVQTVGNSWIICRSRTYAGRTYYFNTLTGEAAWNLSEPEIEKAKKTTRALQNQPDFHSLDCPEPIESPQDPAFGNANKLPKTTPIAPSKIYNKQIINNKFPNNHNFYAAQFSHSNTLNPMTINVPIPAVFNVTPQPIYFTSTSNNQPKFSSHNNIINDQFLKSTSSVPLSERFKNLHQANIKSVSEVFNRNDDSQTATTSTRNTHNKNRMGFPNTPDSDLRLLLTSRRKSLVETDGSGFEKSKEEERRSPHISSDIDDTDNKKNLKVLDTTSLKTKLQIRDDSELWYIIADSNFILNHISFVNALLKSDSQCRLVILQDVINKIKHATTTRLRTQAYHALSSIYENIDANLAIFAEECSENGDDKYEIFTTYNNITDKGYHAVILTDDIVLHSFDDTIPVYTLNELKRLLLVSNAPDSKLEDHDHELSRYIKIIIPNDTEIVSNQDTPREFKFNTSIKEPILGSSYKQPVSKDNGDTQENSVKQPVVDKDSNTFDSNPDIHNLGPIYNLGLSDSNRNTAQPKKNAETSSQTLEKQDELRNDSNHRIHNFGPTSIEESNIQMKKNFETQSKSSQSSAMQDTHNKESPFSLKCSTKHIEDSTKDLQSNASNKEEHNSIRFNNITHNLLCSVVSRLKPNPNKGNEEVSETCSSVTKVPENFIVEETSSEISNSLSVSNKSVDCIKRNPHPGRVYKDARKRKKINPIISKDTIMFEITSQAMEENLRTKCDEWIYRFVQIMEEALTQVLRVDPPYILETMPPPWSLYEAVECIKRKFMIDDEVVETSCKLSDILFEIGGLRGKIKIDLSPEKYMEMYSYGVHVIDALNEILNNNDDLQIAVKSLSSLLGDIQDPHMDQTNQDSFADMSIENQISFRDNEIYKNENNRNEIHVDNRFSAEENNAIGNWNYEKQTNDDKAKNSFIDESHKNFNIQEDEKMNESYQNLENDVSVQSNEIRMNSNQVGVCSGPEKEPIKSKLLDESQSLSSPKSTKSYTTNASSSKYNLRSKWRTTVQKSEEPIQEVTFVRNIDVGPKVSFLSSLHLKKNLLMNESSTTEQQYPAATNFEVADKTFNVSSETVQNEETKTNEPKIVRNFTMFKEYEERLEKNAKDRYEQDNSTVSEMDQAYDELDYDENYEYYDDDYGNEMETQPEAPEHFDENHIDEIHSAETGRFDESRIDEFYTEEADPFDNGWVNKIHTDDLEHFEETNTSTTNNVTFKSVFVVIEEEIRARLILVHNFCEGAYENLTKGDANVKKIGIKKKAEKSLVYLTDVCELMSNILERESGDGGNRIQDIFATGDDLVVDEEDLKNYRILIAKFLQQGITYKSAVEHLIEACKE